jgi:hypothetical protein
VKKEEFVAYTIFTTMDVLSTVFRIREHIAHVISVGNSTKFKRACSVSSGPSNCFQYKINAIMPAKRPLTMVRKLAQY